ncbi:ATP-binding cassette domain-containing protein (plasmid) [Enterococcus faecalis]|nr:ATP-binding cassette domain-containing protein [Enterococcus faecalis]
MEGVGQVTEILSIQHLSKNFGKKQALKNINFTLQQGQIVGLVGPNGAGKTTIMKALLGLIHYQEGTIKINELSISPTSHKGLKEVGALIEYPGIYPFLTGYDHLKLFSETNDKATIDNLVAMLKMTEYIQKKAKSYSLGMKQKLGIALALLNSPELVVLDEPMNGLDPQATRDVREIIVTLAKNGTTFLISSHILSELEKISDQFIIINNGEIIRQCSIEELSQSANHYFLLKTSQDEFARELLIKEKFVIDSSTELKVVKESEEQLSDIIQLLSTNGIQVKDIQHLDNDLESSLLEILDEKKVGVQE